MDTLGGIPWGTDGTLGPMGPWDRWDLGLKDPGPQGPPIIKLDIDYIMNYNMGSQGSPGGSMDPLGGPMGPWDRWDLGLKDPRYFLRGYFLRVVYRYPAQPGPGLGKPRNNH